MGAVDGIEKDIMARDNFALADHAPGAILSRSHIEADRGGEKDVLILVECIKVIGVERIRAHRKPGRRVKDNEPAIPGLPLNSPTDHHRLRREGQEQKRGESGAHHPAASRARRSVFSTLP